MNEDEKLRRLEREARHETDPMVEARRLRELLRAGKATAERLELAAWVGHAPAREAIGAAEPPEELAEWARGIARFGRDACVRALIAGARASLQWRGRFEGPDDELTELVEVVEMRARGEPAPPPHPDEALDIDIPEPRLGGIEILIRFRLRSVVEGTSAPSPDEFCELMTWFANASGLDDLRWWVREDVAPWALDERDPLASRLSTHGRRLGREEGIVRSVAFSPDRLTAVSTSSTGTISLWNLVDRVLVRRFERQRRDVFAVAFAPDGATFASGGMEGGVRIWGLEGRVLSAFRHASGSDDEEVTALAFIAPGRLATGGHDALVKVWDLARTSEPILTLSGHERGVSAIATSLDAKLLASASGDGTVRVWDLATGDKVMVGRAHGTSSVEGVGWLPDGRVVSAGYDGKLVVWNVREGTPSAEMEATRSGAHGLAVSPDGRFAALGCSNSITLVDLTTLTIAREWRWLTSLPLALAFSPGGTRLLCGEREGGLRTFEVG